MIRILSLAIPLALLATAGHAAGHDQKAGQPSLKQLELGANGNGYAVVIDGDGHEYHCKAEETRQSIDLGPCKPLRLVTPLDTQSPVLPPMNPAKRSVVELFERNRCVIGYPDLKRAIESLDTRQRQAVARMVAEMTENGDIVDDEGRERAILRIGDRCS